MVDLEAVKRGRFAVVAVLLLGAMGCAGMRITRGQASPSPITTVAVLEFTSEDLSHAAGAADGCVEGVLEAGFRAVERQRVASVLDEHTQSRSGEMSPNYYRELGQMLGADAFLVGSIQQASFGEPGAVSVRLVSAVTGDVVLMGTLPESRGGLQAIDKGRNACRNLLQAL